MRFFVYGTLQDPEVFKLVAGFDLKARPGLAEGHGLYFMQNQSYPGIAPAKGSVPGLVIELREDLDRDAIDRICYFEEEDVLYKRASIKVRCDDRVLSCQAFFPIDSKMLSEKVWSLDAWSLRHRDDFIANARAYMDAFSK